MYRRFIDKPTVNIRHEVTIIEGFTGAARLKHDLSNVPDNAIVTKINMEQNSPSWVIGFKEVKNES